MQEYVEKIEGKKYSYPFLSFIDSRDRRPTFYTIYFTIEHVKENMWW